MSGNTTATPAPTISKNAYFNYVTVGTKKQRASEQFWTVTSNGKTITIYLQGDVTGKGFTRDATYFAKKHLVTFTGGKQATASTGTGQDKMNRIALKRKFTMTGSQKKGNTPLSPELQRVTGKYSVTPAKNGSTMIFCDALDKDALQKIFADAILAGTNGEAELVLPAEAVWFCPDGVSTPTYPPGVTKADDVVVPIGFEKSSTGDVYLVYHLHGDKVRKH